jgi:hypothetical protein
MLSPQCTVATMNCINCSCCKRGIHRRQRRSRRLRTTTRVLRTRAEDAAEAVRQAEADPSPPHTALRRRGTVYRILANLSILSPQNDISEGCAWMACNAAIIAAGHPGPTTVTGIHAPKTLHMERVAAVRFFKHPRVGPARAGELRKC